MNSICKSYRNIGFETRVLEDVRLHIRKGEYVSLMGPSGAGKSTLMAIMGCLSQPTSGEYILDGEEVGTLNDRKLSRVRNEKIGFVFQAFHLLPGVTALENVILPVVYAKRPPSNIKERARELLAKVGMEHRLHHTPGQLSGGEQQRVTIARSLINNPRIILADEPTGNLDLGNANRLIDLFKKINTDFNQAFVITTHNPEVASIGKKKYYLANGSLSPTDKF